MMMNILEQLGCCFMQTDSRKLILLGVGLTLTRAQSSRKLDLIKSSFGVCIYKKTFISFLYHFFS